MEEKRAKRIVVEEVSDEPSEPKIEEVKAEPVKEPEIKEVEHLKKQNSSPSAPKSVMLWILVPGVFLLGAILGGIVFYQKGVNKSKVSTPQVVASIAPSTAPTATPAANIDITKYTVSILNGSGIPGEAAKAKQILVTAGFKVGTTGNATTYDFTKTIIKAKSTIEPAFISKLSDALSTTYVVDSSQTLADTSKDDIQVIIGSTKN